MMGGISREREISLKTGRAIVKALTEKGYDVCPIDVGQDIAETLIKKKSLIKYQKLENKAICLAFIKKV